MIKLTLPILSLCAFIQIAGAADLTPTEIYSKCFSRLSNHPVDIDSAGYKNVESGSVDPIDECLKVFNRAELIPTGNTEKKIANENDKIALGVLENFQQFHQSWFTGFGTVGNGAEQSYYSFVDYTAPALFITDALLGKRRYQSVFRRGDMVEGVRRSENTSSYFINRRNMQSLQIVSGPLVGGNAATQLTNAFPINFSRISQGRLVGIKRAGSKNIRNRGAYYRQAITRAQWTTNLDDVRNQNITKNFGGGILGVPPYLMMNSESNATLDGGVRVHRRLANNTMSDLLCLSMPNLREGQVDQYLNKYKDSNISFRRDKSCARCHATLDPIANVYRNLQVVSSTNNTFLRNFRAAHPTDFRRATLMRYIKEYKVRTSEQVALDNDRLYRRRTPRGQLLYNSVDGKLVNLPINGLADLGVKVSNQLDPYVCAAQRYYGFITGVKISVNDQENTDFYKTHRQTIVKLGQELKAHNSLQRLVEGILRTDTFQTRYPGFGLEKGGDQ